MALAQNDNVAGFILKSVPCNLPTWHLTAISPVCSGRVIIETAPLQLRPYKKKKHAEQLQH